MTAAVFRNVMDMADTEVGPPEGADRLAMGLSRRADLRVGRIIRESNASGSQMLRLSGEDQGAPEAGKGVFLLR